MIRQIRKIRVYQDGELVGWIPQPAWEPREFFQLAIGHTTPPMPGRYKHPLVNLKSADFKVRWVDDGSPWFRQAVLDADPSLGMGDLETLAGFERAL